MAVAVAVARAERDERSRALMAMVMRIAHPRTEDECLGNGEARAVFCWFNELRFW